MGPANKTIYTRTLYVGHNGRMDMLCNMNIHIKAYIIRFYMLFCVAYPTNTHKHTPMIMMMIRYSGGFWCVFRWFGYGFGNTTAYPRIAPRVIYDAVLVERPTTRSVFHTASRTLADNDSAHIAIYTADRSVRNIDWLWINGGSSSSRRVPAAASASASTSTSSIGGLLMRVCLHMCLDMCCVCMFVVV